MAGGFFSEGEEEEGLVGVEWEVVVKVLFESFVVKVLLIDFFFGGGGGNYCYIYFRKRKEKESKKKNRKKKNVLNCMEVLPLQILKNFIFFFF